MSVVTDLIKKYKHPAIHIVLRGIQHIISKTRDGADVKYLYNVDKNAQFTATTKYSQLTIIPKEYEGGWTIRFAFIKKKYDEETGWIDAFTKIYEIPFDANNEEQVRTLRELIRTIAEGLMWLNEFDVHDIESANYEKIVKMLIKLLEVSGIEIKETEV
jgi:hypothetical protein